MPNNKIKYRKEIPWRGPQPGLYSSLTLSHPFNEGLSREEPI